MSDVCFRKCMDGATVCGLDLLGSLKDRWSFQHDSGCSGVVKRLQWYCIENEKKATIRQETAPGYCLPIARPIVDRPSLRV
jgi:hypothetical protein